MKEINGGLYLCLFSDGTLKVGRGSDPGKRITAHSGAGSCFGISMVKSDIVPCDRIKQAERRLIKWCEQRCSLKACKEWFKGVNYDECLEVAQQLAAASIGPHLPEKASREVAELLDRVFSVTTAESSAYAQGRAVMIERGIVPRDAINALDVLHRVCEKTRREIASGGQVPDWYEELNIMGAWEVEVALADGTPDPELFRAAADALEVIQ